MAAMDRILGLDLHLHPRLPFTWLVSFRVLGEERQRTARNGEVPSYNAASTLALALQGVVWPVFYAVGVLSCVYHLANGIWTAGITWGLWISPVGQKRASIACTVFGVLLGIVGLSALGGAKMTDPKVAKDIEDRMYMKKVETGEMKPDPKKRSEAEVGE